MFSYPPIIISHPIDSDIRMVQVGPGYDPACEPLLAHAGLTCELGGRIEVAMHGMSGVSDKTRQFLTTTRNDLTEEVLMLLAEELNDPVRRDSKRPLHRRHASEITHQRALEVRSDLESIIPVPEDLVNMRPPVTPSTPDQDDSPEP